MQLHSPLVQRPCPAPYIPQPRIALNFRSLAIEPRSPQQYHHSSVFDFHPTSDEPTTTTEHQTFQGEEPNKRKFSSHHVYSSVRNGTWTKNPAIDFQPLQSAGEALG